MGYQTAAGSSIAISAGAPATQDAAGFAALTFTEVGGVEKIGPIGASFAKVDFQPLKGPKVKLKGSADYGSLQPSYAHDTADAGQTLLRTAAKNETNTYYGFRVTLQDGSKYYFQGLVFGSPVTVDGADSVVTAAPMVEVNTKPVEVAAT